MKVAVEKIKESPFELNEDIPAQKWEMDSDDIKFVDAIHIVSRFRKEFSNVIVETRITAKKDIVCSRCLESAHQILEQEVKRDYVLEELGEYLDIDDDIREEILLNFPMKVLCKSDCKGLCPNCGANLNSEQCKCMGKQSK